MATFLLDGLTNQSKFIDDKKSFDQLFFFFLEGDKRYS